VVTLGLVDHDAGLALGVVPVALTAGEYSTGNPYGVWPWAQDRLGAATPQVLPDTEINFERVAALQPDLILAVYSGIGRSDFDTLSKIAPTVAQSGQWGDYQTPWSEMTRMIGAALGRSDQAEATIAAVEQNSPRRELLIRSSRARPRCTRACSNRVPTTSSWPGAPA